MTIDPKRTGPQPRSHMPLRRADLLFCLTAMIILLAAAGFTALAAGRLCLPDSTPGSQSALPVYTSLNQIVEDEPTFAAWQSYDPANPPPLLADQGLEGDPLLSLDMFYFENDQIPALLGALGFAYQPGEETGSEALPLRGWLGEQAGHLDLYLYQYPLEHGLYQISEQGSRLVPCLVDFAFTASSTSFRLIPTGLPDATSAQAEEAQARVQADLIDLLTTGGGHYVQFSYGMGWYPLIDLCDLVRDGGYRDFMLGELGELPESEQLGILADLYALNVQVLQFPNTILVLLSPYDEQVFGFYYDMRLQAYTGLAYQ